MNMIEKVARAFYEAESGQSWDEYVTATGKKWRLRAAKAAIEAMREPSEEMLDVVADYGGGLNNYQTMIDAALKDV